MKRRVDYKHKHMFVFYSRLEERQLKMPSVSSYHCKTGSEVRQSTASCLLAERKHVNILGSLQFSLYSVPPMHGPDLALVMLRCHFYVLNPGYMVRINWEAPPPIF